MFTELLKWINIRENITFLIALASFGLSVWNFVSGILKAQKKLDIIVRNVFCMGPDREMKYTEVLNLNIINKSREAITLSGLEIHAQKRKIKFGEYRLRLMTIRRETGNKEISRSEWYSDIFPIKIEGLGYAHVLLSSTVMEKSIRTEQPYQIKIFSNKGIIKKSVISDYSNEKLLLQCREPNLHTEELR